jgi:hypothetical protein
LQGFDSEPGERPLHTTALTGADFFREGTALASAASDGSVRIFDVRMQHGHPALQFAPAGPGAAALVGLAMRPTGILVAATSSALHSPTCPTPLRGAPSVRRVHVARSCPVLWTARVPGAMRNRTPLPASAARVVQVQRFQERGGNADGALDRDMRSSVRTALCHRQRDAGRENLERGW